MKRLADVEIRPEKSHQHEFNAGRLREALSITTDRLSGSLQFLFYERDREIPVVDECEYTLYNARAGKPRSPEFRLYYSSALIEAHAKTGDLLMITRVDHSNDLQAFVIRRGTDRERELLDALAIENRAALAKFIAIREAFPLPGSTAKALVAVPEKSSAAARHPLVLKAAKEGVLPRPRELAAAAHARVAQVSDPDEFIDQALNVETELFFAAETVVNTPRLHEMIARRDTTLDAMLGFTMSIHQSRKARRGASLQMHFDALLNKEDIPHSAQCKTERGETPDFVIPSCAAYHDREFDERHLRMVACKSTIRERWGQILKEAQRIPEKYLLTLDDKLTDETISKMSRARLRLFVPKKLIAVAYRRSRKLEHIYSVRDLILALRNALP